MKRVIAAMRYRLNGLGWPGWLGLGLLLFALIWHGYGIQRQERQLTQLQAERNALKSRIVTAAQSGIADEDEITRFYRFFESAPVTHWLDKLYAAAEANQVILEKGDYRVKQEENSRLLRYQVTLPVKGAYPQIRRFIDQALLDVPVAALDDIGFKRETIGAPQLDARIRFSIYLGNVPGQAQ